ncbi:hypothetical protein IFVP408_C290111 [Vibrio parahaemolyticus]
MILSSTLCLDGTETVVGLYIEMTAAACALLVVHHSVITDS